jgi:DNA-binding response OmpR family regulator
VPRILLIDDEQDLLEICAMLLESEGHQVECLSDPVRAEEVAQRFRPEVVFLDWVMPERGGREVFPRLREVLGDGARIVIASALPGMSGEARRLGAAGLLEKPFSADELRRWANGMYPSAHPPPG